MKDKTVFKITVRYSLKYLKEAYIRQLCNGIKQKVTKKDIETWLNNCCDTSIE